MAISVDPKPTAPAGPLRGLGMSSVCLGFLGLAFSWLSPLGGILSFIGLVTGWVGWFLASRERRPGLRLALGGAVLSALALALNIFLLAGGWDRYFHL